MSTLAVVPTYLAQPDDLALTLDCLRSLRESEPELDVLIVDDGSVPPLFYELAEESVQLKMDIHRKPDNSGFAKTVNVGLERGRDNGQDVVLVNADVEFTRNGWLDQLHAAAWDGRPAAVAGGLLLYPTGLIQSAGTFFSLLHRCFEHRYRYAPFNLPEAQAPARCPVTAALQLIRHECLTTVGVYDENFLLGWEDVDYALRVFQAGLDCVYTAEARAYHHESMFRGRPSPKIQEWTGLSWIYFTRKWAQENFAEWLPAYI